MKVAAIEREKMVQNLSVKRLKTSKPIRVRPEF
jgi:hypothetical protein